MSGFAADWLALREPADASARDNGLAERLAARAIPRAPLEVVDLGSGTGSNLRWLAPRLPVAQTWTLVEHDPALIEAGSARLGAAPPARYERADLATDLERLVRPGTGLVTASALIDLVSASWLERLARLVRQRRAALLIVLTYDGRIELEPTHALDAEIRDLVNRHQRGDKGFGPALGPEASPMLERLLAADPTRGTLHTASSDWRCGPVEAALQRALITGWAEAAAAMAPERRQAIALWHAARLEQVAAAGGRCRVGHRDLLFLPD